MELFILDFIQVPISLIPYSAYDMTLHAGAGLRYRRLVHIGHDVRCHNHCLVSRFKCSKSLSFIICFVLFAFVLFCFVLFLSILSKFVHIQCPLRNSCCVLNGKSISNCIVLAYFRAQYVQVSILLPKAARHVTLFPL